MICIESGMFSNQLTFWRRLRTLRTHITRYRFAFAYLVYLV